MSDVGGLKAGTILGEEAKPPFAVLPDPSSLFLNRAKRFAALAPNHELGPYLAFLTAVAQAQHDIGPDLPQPALPPFDRIAQTLDHGMPPISRALVEPDAAAMAAIEQLLRRLAAAEMPAETAAVVANLVAASPEERRRKATEVLKDAEPDADLAQRSLIAAGLQVHFARLASLLDAGDLKLVAEGACPVCGSAPATTSVVGWPKAHNTRFCTCSLCATMWNVVRVKCVLCGSTDGIVFRSIEGKPDTVKAETCGKCRSYVKILYQVNDPALEAVADDVATLGLDMLLAEEGWRRGGQNPFLLGY
jgi:FdhE protein